MKNILIAAIFYGLTTAAAQAAFEQVGSGARPGAMANAFTAVSGDVHNLFFNPAGLGMLAQPEVTTMYSKLFTGLTDRSDIGVSLLGVGYPVGGGGRWGSVGLGLWRLKLDSLFSEQSTHLAYAYRWDGLMGGKFSAGAVVKHLQRSYGTTAETQNAINLAGSSLGSPDPVLAGGRTKSGFGLDVGAIFQWGRYYSAGLAAQNINEPDMALGSGDRDVIPRSLQAGVSFKAARTLLSADLIQRQGIPGRTDRTLGLGLERRWLTGAEDALSLRAGMASGSRGVRKVSLGLGYQFSRLVMGYAFEIPLGGVSRTDGSHQLSLSFQFGRPLVDNEEVLERMLKKEQDNRSKAEKALEEAALAKVEAQRKLELMKKEIELLRRSLAARTGSGDDAEKLARKELEAEEERKRVEEEQKKVEEEERKAREAVLNAYNLSWNLYQRRIAGGLSMADRIEMLEKIVAKYSGLGQEIREAAAELARVKKIREELTREFEDSWNYYKQLSHQGASVETRLELLERILKKFEGKEVNLQEVRQEVDNLNKLLKKFDQKKAGE